jgi:hypothetical protein
MSFLGFERNGSLAGGGNGILVYAFLAWLCIKKRRTEIMVKAMDKTTKITVMTM